MQDQLTEAISNVVRSTMAGGLPPNGAPAKAGGRRLLAAMIAARDGDCNCHPCQLLIAELDDAVGDLLKGVSNNAGSPDNLAVAGPANRRQRRS